MKSRNSRPAPCQSSASAPRFASFSTWSGKAGAPMPLAQQRGHLDAGPAQVRRHEQAPGAVDQAGERDRRARGHEPLLPRRGHRVAGELREVAEDLVDRAAAVVDRHERRVALLAGEVRGARREEVDADLQAEARRRRAR